MTRKKKASPIELPKHPTNLNYSINVPQEVVEEKNEVVVDLNSGFVKIYSTTESLDVCMKKADEILKKISGPDLSRYVS